MPEEDQTPPEGGTTYSPPATQKDLDRIVGERLAREREKYADYTELKAKADKFDQVEASNKSELQKLQDAVNERDAKLTNLPNEVRGQVLKFARTAQQMGFLDPEDALVFMGSVDLGDDDAVKAALDDLAERKPHLVRPPKKPPVTDRPKAPKGTSGTEDTGDQPTGKARAAAALRQMRDTH